MFEPNFMKFTLVWQRFVKNPQCRISWKSEKRFSRWYKAAEKWMAVFCKYDILFLYFLKNTKLLHILGVSFCCIFPVVFLQSYHLKSFSAWVWFVEDLWACSWHFTTKWFRCPSRVVQYRRRNYEVNTSCLLSPSFFTLNTRGYKEKLPDSSTLHYKVTIMNVELPPCCYYFMHAMSI